MNTFESELEKLLNKYSIENESDTPDFILSKYIMRSLKTWKESIEERDLYYERIYAE